MKTMSAGTSVQDNAGMLSPHRDLGLEAKKAGLGLVTTGLGLVHLWPRPQTAWPHAVEVFKYIISIEYAPLKSFYSTCRQRP